MLRDHSESHIVNLLELAVINLHKKYNSYSVYHNVLIEIAIFHADIPGRYYINFLFFSAVWSNLFVRFFINLAVSSILRPSSFLFIRPYVHVVLVP